MENPPAPLEQMAHEQEVPTQTDLSLGTPEARARDLLISMTLEEKAQQLTSVTPFRLMRIGGPSRGQLEAELKLGIGHIAMFSMFQHQSTADHARTVNQIQRYLVEETRLGIPAMFHLEALNGIVAPEFTVFPTAISLASTWNTAAVREMASILRRQARSIGYLQALSPVMDVARDARWGRVHETYGEDPYLVSEFSVAYTAGLQGDDLTVGVIATGKHFLGFAMTQGGQHMASTAVGGRELREVYARPFEAAIQEAGLASIMNSYSPIDGIPAGANRGILTDLLRGDLKFRGTVVADYGTIGNLVDLQQVAKDSVEAGVQALEAGLDVELPDARGYGPSLVDAVRRGLVSEDLVDRSVLRVLRDKFSVGLFDNPYVDDSDATLAAVAIEGVTLARQLAEESVILLRNDAVLPLSKKIRRIAVVGPHANNVSVGFPAYTYLAGLGLMGAVDTGDSVNMAGLEDAGSGMPEAARAMLKHQLAPHLQNGHDQYAREHYGAMSLVDAIKALVPDADVVGLSGCGILDDEDKDFTTAEEAAKGADVVILALGGRAGWFGDSQTEGEGSDQANIDLPAAQVELARIIAQTGTPVVGVVFTGRPFALAALDDHVSALVYANYGGQFGTVAVAGVLFGDINPSGKLPISLPRHSGQIPLHYGQHVGSGYRRTTFDQHKGYNDLSARPLYPFGHGVNYSNFAYRDFELHQSAIQTDGEFTAQVTVTNTGNRSGTEVVQFYASSRVSGVTRPAQELIAFARVELGAREARTIRIRVSMGQLAYVGAEGHLTFEDGRVEIQVGSSSENIHFRAEMAISGPPAAWPLRRPLLPDVDIDSD